MEGLELERTLGLAGVHGLGGVVKLAFDGLACRLTRAATDTLQAISAKPAACPGKR